MAYYEQLEKSVEYVIKYCIHYYRWIRNNPQKLGKRIKESIQQFYYVNKNPTESTEVLRGFHVTLSRLKAIR